MAVVTAFLTGVLLAGQQQWLGSRLCRSLPGSVLQQKLTQH